MNLNYLVSLFLPINFIFVNALVKDIETDFKKENRALSPLSLKSNKKSPTSSRKRGERIAKNNLNCESRNCTINFGAFPSQIKTTVIEQFSLDLLNFKESPGVGIAELSIHTEAFKHGILGKANEAVYELSGYSKEDWAVLWMSGGTTSQFAAVPLNFKAGKGKAVYLVTGYWSEKAAEDAKKILGEQAVIIVDLRENFSYTDSKTKTSNYQPKVTLKSPKDWIDKVLEVDVISYIYYCENETIDGIELPHPNYFQDILESRLSKKNTQNTQSLPSIPFVGDLSSNFFTRELPDSEGSTGLLIAGVQGNLGAAGVTLVLIKRKLLEERIRTSHRWYEDKIIVLFCYIDTNVLYLCLFSLFFMFTLFPSRYDYFILQLHPLWPFTCPIWSFKIW